MAIVQGRGVRAFPDSGEHGGEEIVYVLAGTFVDQYRSSGPGTVIRGAAGRSHRPGPPDGVTFMVVPHWLPASAIA